MGGLGDAGALVGEGVRGVAHRRLAISVHVGEARQRRRRRVRGDYVAMAWHAPEAVALSTMARKVLAMAEAQP